MTTPMQRRDAALRAMRDHPIWPRRACVLIGVDPKTVRRERRPDPPDIRKEMRKIAEKRRRFGYRRVGIMLERKGMIMNEKKLYRLYREEGLSVRRRRGRKRARGSRTPMPVPLRPNQRWSLDFVSDTFGASRKFRILAVNDDCCRENLGLIADTSISGARVAAIKALTAPLLTHHDDLFVVGRLVALKPVHHLLRGIYLDGASGRGAFTPRWFFLTLFEPRERVSFRWEMNLKPPASGWNTSAPDIVRQLAERVEAEALPILRSIATITDYRTFGRADRGIYPALHRTPLHCAIVDAALGDFEAAEATCRMLVEKPPGWLGRPEYKEDVERVILRLYPLIKARDRAGIAALLHAWEAQSVKNIKLEKVWEKTPFPVEQA